MAKRKLEPPAAFGQEMLDEDFVISGNREHGIVGNIKEFSASTHYEVVCPQNFEFFSLLNSRQNKDEDYNVIRIKPDDADIKLFMPKSTRNLHFLPQKGNMGKLNISYLKSIGVTDKQMQELDSIGFFLQYRDRGTFITLFPSRAFLATLCRQLGVGKLNEGIDPIRDIYLASRMKTAEDFTLVYRTQGAYGKAFGCFSTKFEQNPQTIIFDFKKYLSEVGNVSIRGWKINHFITTVDFAFNNISVKIEKAKITPGVRLTMSDVGDSSYILQNAFYLNGGVVLCSQSVAKRHTGVLNVDEMTERYKKDVYPKLKSIIEEIEAMENAAIEIRDREEAIRIIMAKIGFVSAFGNANAAAFRKECVRNMQGPGSLFDVALFMLKIPGVIHRLYPDSTVNRVSECTGKVLEMDLRKVLKV